MKRNILKRTIVGVVALNLVAAPLTQTGSNYGLPEMSLTAYADDLYASLKNTTTEITFDGKSWYLIDYDESTVTLLAKECVTSSQYNLSGTFVEYSRSTVRIAVDNWYNNNITADAKTAVSGSGMFLLTTDQAFTIQNANINVLKCSMATGADRDWWWLSSPSTESGWDDAAAVAYGDDGVVNDSGKDVDMTLGVRPALKLDLFEVEFDSATNTFSVGSMSKDPVSYMAWDETEKKLVEKTGDDACKEYEVVTAETTTWGTAGQTSWYVVNSDVTISSEEDEYDIKDEVVKLEGNVNLILCDGACLTVSSGSLKGIYVGGYSLTIYAQSTGASMGELKVNTESDSIRSHRGDVSIIGGSVDAHGGIKAVYGNVNISGGSVTVTVTDNVENAICADGRITINGGTVKATGGFNSAISTSAGVTISGGTVTATTPVEDAIGINANNYSDVTISGGEFTAIGDGGGICYAKVKNAIAGTGWTNTEGTEGKADIAISETGQNLSSYKKVQFPAAAKATPVVGDFIFTAPTNLAYNGTAKSANVVAKDGINGMGDVTVKYYSDAECTAELVGTPTDVGTYYVGITVAEGDNYNAVSTVLHDDAWKFTIGKATPDADDFSFMAPSSLGYDGADKTATVVPGSGVIGMGEVTVKYYSDAACTDEVENPKNVGTYYVGITVSEGTNYSVQTTVLHDDSWTFTISPKNLSSDDITLAFDPASAGYTGEAQAPVLTVCDGTTPLEVNTDYTSNVAAKTAAATYTFTITGKGNYTGTKSGIWCINKAANTGSISFADKTYNGEAVTPTVNLAENLPQDSSVTYAYYKVVSGQADQLLDSAPKDAGSYKVIATIPESTNYNEKIINNLTFEITPKSVTITGLEADGKTYDGTTSATVTGTAVIDGKVGNDNVSVAGGSAVFADENVGTDIAVTFTGYTLIGGDEGNYTLSAQPAGVNADITPAPLTITANPKTITYGDTPANDGVEYSGFVNSETENVLGGTLGYTYSYEQYGNIGNTYTITPGGLTSSNYDITFANGTLTVEPKEIGIDWSDITFTYDGEAHKPAAAATGLINSDTCTVTVSGEETNAGENYTATATALSNSNYKLPENASTQFTIRKADYNANVVPAAIDDLVYTGRIQALFTNPEGVTVQYKDFSNKTAASAIIAGFSSDEGWSDAIPSAAAPGVYIYAYRIVGDNNHNASPDVSELNENNAGSFVLINNIDKAVSAVTAPTAKTGLTYTGEAQALITAGSATGGTLQYSLDGESYSVNIPAGTDAKETLNKS